MCSVNIHTLFSSQAVLSSARNIERKMEIKGKGGFLIDIVIAPLKAVDVVRFGFNQSCVFLKAESILVTFRNNFRCVFYL